MFFFPKIKYKYRIKRNSKTRITNKTQKKEKEKMIYITDIKLTINI